MRIAKRSQATIDKRLELLYRLSKFIAPTSLTEASREQLLAFQATFADRAPATVDIYTRHMRAFYGWALDTEFIAVDPTVRLPRPHVPKGVPHPTATEDLTTIFACTVGGLRRAYVLAAFAGLRCGEICRLQAQHIDRYGPRATAWIQGKGGRERTVPLLAPVLEEIAAMKRTGWVVTTTTGHPYTVPNRLSVDSHNHLSELGIETTLHSMRHWFATNVQKLTKDPLLVQALLGHESLASTQIYVQNDMSDAAQRMQTFANFAGSVVERPHLRIVR
ncbi:tyrosine-type recombinase/integrase [Mycobacterium sp.]|jgi:integrase/recombinase XerC|uniref:tyrosine-type recombinase/integrase n=1 Tax=Mycobacterium sp. TaxID=1785 RepID=UPI0039C9EF16